MRNTGNSAPGSTAGPDAASRIIPAASWAPKASVTRSASTSANRSPVRSLLKPIRWKADSALGLAYRTRPLASIRTKPSPARGVDNPASVPSSGGKVPSATIWYRSSADA